MLIAIIVIIFLLILISVWTWYHPESFLIPINLLYNFDPSHRCNFYTDTEKDIIFPVGIELESNWQDIRQEGHELYESLPNKDINYLNNYHMNMGEETKCHWTTIPLRLFGRDSIIHMGKCPLLEKILREHPEIKSCLFSIMDSGKIIKPHVGPYDGLLRYQLALDIPKITMSSNSSITKSECYLHVGGEKYEWIEGKGILFDEANLHGAINTTSQKRIVLLIDLERPYSLLLFRIINKGILWVLNKINIWDNL
jgi:aspartyl/asparaginyl beta-hydroxylase (cupin superfamily)